MKSIRFAVDSGLGSLARNLRMLGFDTYWQTGATDSEVLEAAREEGRVLLTRNEELFRQADPQARHRVQAEGPGAELREVLEAFSLLDQVRSGRGFFSLCLQCNSPLLPVKPHHLTERLGRGALLADDDFYLCSRCERVYAKGDYYRRMKRWVEGLVGELGL